jgi:hypothetical protein
MVTTRPACWDSIQDSTARAHSIVPRRSTSTARHQLPVSTPAIGPSASMLPAQVTSSVGGPRRDAAAPKRRVNFGWVSDVERNRDDSLLRQCLELPARACETSDGNTISSKRTGNSTTDATARTGHERDAPR